MKKLVLLFILGLISTGLFAQFNFGPKIGYNSTKLSLDKNDIKSDLRNNFQFGAFIRIGRKIYVQPEVNWVSQGSIFKTPENSVFPEFDQEIKMQTIQVPLLIGIKLINLKLFNFRVFGGPAASYVTKIKIDNRLAAGIEPISEADLEDMIWSVQAGAGIDIANFTIDIRYNFGINNAVEVVQIGGQDIEFDSKTNGFAVTLGFKII